MYLCVYLINLGFDLGEVPSDLSAAALAKVKAEQKAINTMWWT
jgi:hypothetical protein